MKLFLSWSGGKDSSLCLYTLREQGLPVQALLTHINAAHNRVSMHGVRRSLITAQAAALGIPLQTIELPEEPTMQEYEKAAAQKMQDLKNEGFTHAAYGDLFLEDLKQYREAQLQPLGITPLFPLWRKDTRQLLINFIETGFKAIIVCTAQKFLDKSFCGRLLDASFLQDLPPGVDPCGENGEYHSFVFDGPLFTHPVAFTKGEIVRKTYQAPGAQNGEDEFYFCDLLPQTN